MSNSSYVELYKNQHNIVYGICRGAMDKGEPWLSLPDLKNRAGGMPVTGAVMKLRAEGKLQTRITKEGKIEVSIQL